VRSGKALPEEQQEVLLREQRALAWDVLRKDLVEKHGHLPGALPREEALGILAREMSQNLAFPLDRIHGALRGWVKERLLQWEADERGWRWRWAATNEILDGGKTNPERAP
jgi:hypothetical protein